MLCGSRRDWPSSHQTQERDRLRVAARRDGRRSPSATSPAAQPKACRLSPQPPRLLRPSVLTMPRPYVQRPTTQHASAVERSAWKPRELRHPNRSRDRPRSLPWRLRRLGDSRTPSGTAHPCGIPTQRAECRTTRRGTSRSCLLSPRSRHLARPAPPRLPLSRSSCGCDRRCASPTIQRSRRQLRRGVL
jgi:hypothetical protein